MYKGYVNFKQGNISMASERTFPAKINKVEPKNALSLFHISFFYHTLLPR